MRKLKILFLIMVLLLGLAIFAGCGETEVSVTSISIVDGKEVIAIGEFYYEDYSVAVTYDDGTTKIVALTEDMLPATERIKLLQEGKHTLTVSAFGQTCEFALEVKRRTIDNATFESMSNATNYVQATYDEKKGWYHFEAVYTGDPYVVTVGGLLPDGYSVNFPEGNSFTNAGEYEISAIISCSQYESKIIYALVTIDKADYDFSELKFENKVCEYDGTMKYLNYEGKLPEGLTGKYYIGGNASGIDMVEGNGAEKAGIYYVALVISGGDKNNYNDIVNPYAILNIKKKEIKIDDIKWTESEFVYDSNPHEVRILDQNLPEGLNPAISYDNNMKYEAGTYTAIAKLSVLDPENYTVQPYVEKEFVIKQAEYDLSGIGFESTIADYDGEEKVLECTFGKDYELPQGLTIEYSENRFINVGVYEVTLTFKNEDVNFVTPEPLSANLVILAQKHALSEYSFPSVECSYDGNEHELPTILNLPEYFLAEYTYSYSFVSEGSLGMTESGYIVKPAIDENGNVVKVDKPDTYTVFAKVSVVDENYAIEGVDEVSATLKIFAPAINMYPYEIGFVEPEKPFAFNGKTQGAALAIPENSAYDLTVSKYEGKEPKKIQEVENCSAETTYGGIVPGKYQVTILLYYPAYKEDMIANNTAMEASMEFEIVNAVYTDEDFYFENKTVVFDGMSPADIGSVMAMKEMPYGVKAEYSIVNMDDTPLNVSVIKPGGYKVLATIFRDETAENYNEYKDYFSCDEVSTLTATLTVTKAQINITPLAVEAEYPYVEGEIYPYNFEDVESPFTANYEWTAPSGDENGYFSFGENFKLDYSFIMERNGVEKGNNIFKIDQIDVADIVGSYKVFIQFDKIESDCIDVKFGSTFVESYAKKLLYSFDILPLATIDFAGYDIALLPESPTHETSLFYDKQEHTYNLSILKDGKEAALPEHVNLKYTYTIGDGTTEYDGNTFKEVGVYHLKATLVPESSIYVIPDGFKCFEATITIELTTITLPDNELNGATISFDCSAHKYSLKNALPAHVNVAYTYTKNGDSTTYVGNEFTDVGVYHLTATLSLESDIFEFAAGSITVYIATITITSLDYNSLYLGLRYTNASSPSEPYSSTKQVYYQLATVSNQYTSAGKPNFYFGNGPIPGSSATAFYIKSGDNYNPIDESYFKLKLKVVSEGNIVIPINTVDSMVSSGALGNIFKVTADNPAVITFSVASADSRVTIKNTPASSETSFEIKTPTVITQTEFLGDGFAPLRNGNYPAVCDYDVIQDSMHEVTPPYLKSEYTSKMTMAYNGTEACISSEPYGTYKQRDTYRQSATFTCKEGYVFWTDEKTYTMDIEWIITYYN